MTDTQTRPTRTQLHGPLLRYQVMSYVTTVGLVTLLFVAMPLEYFAGNTAVVGLVGPAHGLVYMIYLLCVFDLGNRLHWPLKRTVLIMLAGCIPLGSILVERSVRRKILAETTA